MRDLTRQRANLVQERAAVTNQLQKALEWANIKLAGVATSVTGVSARNMLEAISEDNDPEQLADMAKGRLRKKRVELEKALEGRVRDHHRFMIASHLVHLDFLEEQISVFEEAIARSVENETERASASLGDSREGGGSPRNGKGPVLWTEAINLLDSIPGWEDRRRELLAEIGANMDVFGGPGQLASWCKVCPGNNESAGKQYSGRTGRGNVWLEPDWFRWPVLMQVKNSYLGALYRNLVPRLGPKKAIMAIVHRIVRAIYFILSRGEPWHDRGTDYLPERRRTT